MNPELVQAFVAPMFLLVGLSHVVQPRAWAEFFAEMSKGRMARFIIPIYTLPVALVLLVGHNVWEWSWSLFLTIAGWGMTIKSTLYLLIPGFADRVLARNFTKRPFGYAAAGAVMALFGGILT
jgi:hypothetical protein